MSYRKHFQHADLPVMHITEDAVITDTEAVGAKFRIRQALGKVEGVFL